MSHAGLRLPAEVAEGLGLTEALSDAMARTRQRRSGHDPGTVLVDVAPSLIDGGKSLSDLAVVRNQPEIFGPVASTPTAWRTVDSIDNQVRAALSAGRASARRRAWEAGVRPRWIVMDLDATLVTAQKHRAAPTYKRSFGFHPLVVYLDGTEEALSGMLRPGNAGSNTAVDHIAVVDDALAQLPVATKAKDPKNGEWMLLRADSASCTHDFVAALRDRGVEFSIGFPLLAEIHRGPCSD